MEKKKWYQSRTIVSDILTIFVAVYMAIQHVVPALPALPPGFVESALLVLGSLGIFGRVTANTKVGV